MFLSIDLRVYFIVLLLFFLSILLFFLCLCGCCYWVFFNMKLHIGLNFGYFFYWLSEFFSSFIHFSLNFSISISKITEMRELNVCRFGFNSTVLVYFSIYLRPTRSIFFRTFHVLFIIIIIIICVLFFLQFEFYSAPLHSV